MNGELECTDKFGVLQCFPEYVRKEVVEILKTGTVVKERINEEHIVCFLEVSSISPPLKEACQEKLLETVNIANCVDALEIAEKYELLLLKKEAANMIVENFENFWLCESFLRIGEQFLETICTNEKVAKHPDIFQALEKWVQHEHENRFKTYYRLLQIIQQQRSPNKCQGTRKSYTSYHAMLLMPQSKAKHSVMTAVFNCDGDMVCHRNLFKSNDIRDNFCAACVQTDETEAPYVYISSGKNVIRYDPMLNTHINCDHLIHARVESSMVALEDHIFVIGGHHNGNNVLEIEELDTKHDRHTIPIKTSWKVVAKIPENISLHSAPCVAFNENIYIIGEQINKGDPSTIILVFNPIEKSVEIAAEFPKKCSDCQAVRHESNIYIASSEGYFIKFDTESNIFSSCSDLPTKSIHFGMFVEGDLIYTVGGSVSDNSIDKFEKDEYDIQTNSWKRGRELICNLPIYGSCDIKVPSYTNVIPFYDSPFKEIR